MSKLNLLQIWLLVVLKVSPDDVAKSSGASKEDEFALLECISIIFQQEILFFVLKASQD